MMAPRWIERIKSSLKDSLSELLEDAPPHAKLSFEHKVRNQLGQAVAERYRLQKTLDGLPEFETGFTLMAEDAIDTGDDNRAKAILRQKAEAVQARRAVEIEIEDLAREIAALEDLSRLMKGDEASPAEMLARLEKMSDSGFNEDNAIEEKD